MGAWLLLAGGIGVIGGAIIQTMDFNTHMHLAALAQTTLTLFLFYARMWVYPQASMLFLAEVKASGASKGLLIASHAGVGIFGFFNIMLCLLFAEKSYRYIRKSLPGGNSIKVEDSNENVPEPCFYSKELLASAEAIKQKKHHL